MTCPQKNTSTASDRDRLQMTNLKIFKVRHPCLVEFDLVLIFSQASYYSQASQVLSDLTNKLGWKKGDLSDEDCQQQLQQKLAEIKSLSIVEDG